MEYIDVYSRYPKEGHPKTTKNIIFSNTESTVVSCGWFRTFQQSYPKGTVLKGREPATNKGWYHMVPSNSWPVFLLKKWCRWFNSHRSSPQRATIGTWTRLRVRRQQGTLDPGSTSSHRSRPVMDVAGCQSLMVKACDSKLWLVFDGC